MSRLVTRDPFARQELHAERVSLPTDHQTDTCKWCGTVRTTKRGGLWLYRFFVEDDQGRLDAHGAMRQGEIRGLFCSRDCMESYHTDGERWGG